MDRQSLTGILLILLVTFVWMFISQPQRPPADIVPPDSLSSYEQRKSAPPADDLRDPLQREAITPQPAPQQIDIPVAEIDSSLMVEEKLIRINSDLLDVTISNRGGARLQKWILKKYDYYLGGQVNLVGENGLFDLPGNGLNTEIVNKRGDRIELRNHDMLIDAPANDIVLDESNPTATLEYYLPIGGGRIIKRYTFHYDRYAMDIDISFENLENYIGNRWYTFSWQNGLRTTEENTTEDLDYGRAYAYMNGELFTLDVSDEETVSEQKNGRINWTAIRTKYFLCSIIPETTRELDVELIGEGVMRDETIFKLYNTNLSVELPERGQSSRFTVFLGPLDYDILGNYKVDLEDLVMNKDWYEGLFRWISLLILPAFKFLHSLIPNYGWVIIIFSVLVKVLLHPLTRKSYQSMSQMQTVQPKMTAMREKYKDDPQRLNKEMMKFYKEEGINPLGGCLPTLLQMPLLFALFIVFRSTIQLRGEPFIGWITDLARPDTLALGFSLPFFGDSIHVLPFLMGVTMIWQSKMTVTDPKQKFMIYLMPVFLTFIFYSFPSGLNLYYAVFNVLTMVQTKMIKGKLPSADQPAVAAAASKKAPAKAPAKSAAKGGAKTPAKGGAKTPAGKGKPRRSKK